MLRGIPLCKITTPFSEKDPTLQPKDSFTAVQPPPETERKKKDLRTNGPTPLHPAGRGLGSPALAFV